MYTLIRRLTVREGLLVELPAAATSLVVAEFFFKFHSFTLECLAFLATWVAVSAALTLLVRPSKAASPAPALSPRMPQ